MEILCCYFADFGASCNIDELHSGPASITKVSLTFCLIQALTQRGNVYLKQGNLDAATQDFREIVSIYKYHAKRNLEQHFLHNRLYVTSFLKLTLFYAKGNQPL